MYGDSPLFALWMVFLIMFFLLIISPNIHGCSPYHQNLRKWLIFFFFSNSSITTIYSDGGKVYQGLTSVFAAHGIQHLIIPPYTPQHIASVECRHTVETGLTLLHHAHLRLSLWSFTFKIAIYHINRVPAPFLKNRSPFECLFNSKPNFSKLKIFGCLCYPWLRPYTSHKLEQRSRACLFLGYSN